jgi:hypothetical protein
MQSPPPPRDMHDALLAAGVSSKQSGSEAMLCTRCGHSARSHRDSSSCSHRGRWWRRCQCGGYTGFDSVRRP